MNATSSKKARACGQSRSISAANEISESDSS